MAHTDNIEKLPEIRDGLKIEVKGTIHPDANRFAINLCTGPNRGECDIALHVNPRYNQGNVVVRNTRTNGAWGGEERDGPPFHVSKGSHLECSLKIKNDFIKVSFNGDKYCKYHHRIPKERITHIIVDGDVTVSKISIDD